MRELPEFTELRAAWLNQPEEEIPVDIERIHRRRTWALFSTTRSEIISSIGAALFFAAMVAWRFAPERDRLVLFGCAGVIVWAAVTVFRFRNSIRRHTPQPDALARTGLDHYRVELLTAHCCWPVSSPPRLSLKGSFPAAFGIRCPSFSC